MPALGRLLPKVEQRRRRKRSAALLHTGHSMFGLPLALRLRGGLGVAFGGRLSERNQIAAVLICQ
jgi:hypothetical protein